MSGIPVESQADRIERRVRRTELIISHTLRAGVLASLVIVTLGIVVTLVRHPEYLTSRTELAHLTSMNAVFPHSVREVMASVLSFRGRGLVLLGLFVLIATPVVRVAISIVAFAVQGDRVFVVITSCVLAILLLSFVVGHSG